MNRLGVLIIAGILVVMLIAFGRNPVQDAREKRARALQGKDPLIQSIEQHNAKTHGNNYTPPSGAAQKTYPDYMLKNPQNPYNTGGQPAVDPNQYPLQSGQSDYYPPPPLPGTAVPGQPAGR